MMNQPPDGSVQQRMEAIGAIPFDRLPSEMTVRAFEVEYGRVRTLEGGDLFITRYGWPFLAHLLPENWYAEGWYAKAGERLSGSTGRVYRVPTKPVNGNSIDMVVKFSRVAQEVPLVIGSSFPDEVLAEDVANARFNSPVEEFGLVMEMRRGTFGPRDIRMLAHRPLAIYAPPEAMELWQSGRSHGRFHAHKRLLAGNQGDSRLAIELDIKRPYVLIYGWLKGENAEEIWEAGDITEGELRELTRRVTEELRAKGFRVLDNKPKHFILRRQGNNGAVIRRAGKLVYGLVDFELLERTAGYQRRFRSAQRSRYWEMQSHRWEEPSSGLPPHLNHMKILGVNYLFGIGPNGGKIWTVGNCPDLFDFFLPDRWRRTQRRKLSPTNEVYRTRTRDDIHVVYRRSRMGETPSVDPYYEHWKRIREYGYNSPFEEFAIAEHLRQAGLPTAYPRAVYRTDHKSTRTGQVLDDHRYVSHADMMTPEGERILSSDHDYYTIWGSYRGIDPQKHYRRHGHWGFIDVEKAHEDGLLDAQLCQRVVIITRARLAAIGVAEGDLDNSDFLLRFGEHGALRRDASGELDVTWCLSALRAYEYGLIPEDTYRDTVDRCQAKIRAAGCEALDLAGHHMLLSLNPDGVIARDEKGKFEITLCSFQLIRMPACSTRAWEHLP